jgi:hypothetical protein
MAGEATNRAPQGTTKAVEASLEAIGQMIAPKFRKAGCKAVALRLNEVASTLEPPDGISDLIDSLAAAVTSLQATAQKMGSSGGSAADLAAEKARADKAEAHLAMLHGVISQAAVGVVAAPVKATRAPRSPKVAAPTGPSTRTLSATRAVPKSGLTKTGKKRGRPFGSKNLPAAQIPQSNGSDGEMTAYQAMPEIERQISEHTEG